MCKSPAKGVLFEWSHNVIFSGQTQKSELEKLGVGQITEVFVSNSWKNRCYASDYTILGT